jgi:hypothetical protein
MQAFLPFWPFTTLVEVRPPEPGAHPVEFIEGFMSLPSISHVNQL